MLPEQEKLKHAMLAQVDQMGKLRHDFTVPLHYAFVLWQLGGEDLLKRKYQHLYKILQDTQQRALTGQRFKRTDPVVADDPYIHGMRDSREIRTVNFSYVEGLTTSSRSIFVQKKPVLVISSEVRDVINDKTLDGFSVFDSNSQNLQGGSITPSACLIKSDSREYKVISTFQWVEYDERGDPYFMSETAQHDGIKVLGNLPLVKSITVMHPLPIRHPGAEKTTIFYNRNGNCDYSYEEVHITPYELALHIPFKGWVELNSAFFPMHVDKNRDFILQIETDRYGTAGFNTRFWDDVKWTIAGNRLYWKFPDNWHAALSIDDIYSINNIDFYCRMGIVVRTEQGELPVPVKIVIQSNGEASPDPSYRKISQINLLWGCLAKDTPIRMADNSEKAVQEVHAGDRVMTRSGGSAVVSNVITGLEENVTIIKSRRGNLIRVSEMHPLLTEKGLVLAKNLSAGSVLMMEYGSDAIEWLYCEQYNGPVYSLDFDTETVLIAGGFYVGDFKGQQSAMASHRAEQKRRVKLLPFQEEMAELIPILHEQRRRK